MVWISLLGIGISFFAVFAPTFWWYENVHLFKRRVRTTIARVIGGHSLESFAKSYSCDCLVLSYDPYTESCNTCSISCVRRHVDIQVNDTDIVEKGTVIIDLRCPDDVYVDLHFQLLQFQQQYPPNTPVGSLIDPSRRFGRFIISETEFESIAIDSWSGSIVVIALGCIVAVFLLLLVGVCWCKRREETEVGTITQQPSQECLDKSHGSSTISKLDRIEGVVVEIDPLQQSN